MPKLNREQMFNQDFVRYIKAHKCLYDHNSIEYRQKELYEQAWEDVSKKCGESVAACRRRWRNLKTSTCRFIKQMQKAKANDNISGHKEYYLYADMKFVIPFLKSRQDADDSDESPIQQSNKNSNKRIKIERPTPQRSKKQQKYQEYELVTGDDEGDYIIQRPSSAASDDAEVTSIIEIDRDQGMVEVHESCDETPHIVQVEKETENATTFTLSEVPSGSASTELSTDELFLKSLLPDITTMSKEQKRKFKIRVLTLIDEILS